MEPHATLAYDDLVLPFREIPRNQISEKAWVVSLVFLLLGSALLELRQGSSTPILPTRMVMVDQQASQSPTASGSVSPAMRDLPKGREFYTGLWQSWKELPLECFAGSTSQVLNSLQQEGCKEVMGGLWIATSLAFVPLLFALLLHRASMKSAILFYKRAERTMRFEQHTAKGKVTNPPRGDFSFWSWILNVRPIRVQLPDKTQISVWTDRKAGEPQPGTAVAVWKIGTRWIGKLDLPHLFVV